LRKPGFCASISAHDECTTTALLAKLAGIPTRIGFFSTAKGSRFYTHRLRFDPNLHVIENRYRTLKVLSEELALTVSPPPLKRVTIRYTEKERNKISRLLENLGYEKVVAIHPFAKRRYQEWGVDKFVQLAHEIVSSESACACLILSNGNQIPATAHPRVKVVEKTSLLELAALLQKVDVFVGNNSGPMHIAAAQGTKTIWISGPSAPYWRAFAKDVYLRMISAGVSCAPCDKPHRKRDNCTNVASPMICMERVGVTDVLSEVMRAIHKEAATAFGVR
jgi:ADP-heptose:LPS heptosyltransferase